MSLPTLVFVVRFSAITLTLILLNSIYIISYNSTYVHSEPNGVGGYAEEINFIRFSNENVAYQEVNNGNLDMYLFQIPLQLIDIAKNNPNLRIYEKEGLSYGLLLNPAVNDMNFNPFSITEVRYALNFLIDRNLIVNDILKGYGIPIIEPYGPTSPEYNNIINVVEPLQIRHDPAFATDTIRNSLKKAGVQINEDGKFIKNGSLVTIKMLIRNDDLLRKTFGDIVASELERIGFTVLKEYGDLTKANRVVYGSNPKDLEWNIYTESFISGTFSRYNPGTVGQMYAPWFGNMPGSQNPVFWQYANSSIDDKSQQLVFNNYTSEDERNRLLADAELIGIQEAVRLFFARSYEPYIASSLITGLINDFSAGIANKISIMNTHKDANFDTLNIGMKQVFQDAWNNIKGCSDFYCRIIYSLISDNSLLTNPYSGDPQPFRNNWSEIISMGPEGMIKVPNDAIIWDPRLQKWQSNNPINSTALTKVTMNPLFSLWHNGQPMDVFDLIYAYYFPFEWATESNMTDLYFDAEYASLVNPSLSILKGIKFYNNGTFDSYTDIWHYDHKQLPLYGSLWASEPWEITAASERLVSANKFSFSKTNANIKQIEQLSLNFPSHAEHIKNELIKMKEENYIPNPLKDYISKEYAIDRYESSIQWIENHQNAVIGNGPYFLNSFNPNGGSINLIEFNDPTYPFNEGAFSLYDVPPIVAISSVNVPKFVKIGEPLNFEIVLKHSTNNSLDDMQININYFVTNRNNDIIIDKKILHLINSTGILNNTSNSTDNLENIFISLNSSETENLIPGPAKLKMIIRTDEFPKPTILEHTLIVRP